ncbi:MAG: hypothetical protein HQ514_14045, partial [Rhodospirillales bacterium]|nr:hypothetical protein [Rhodospirillales bacterium]
WEDYIKGPSDQAAIQGYRVLSEGAFRPLRRVLANVVKTCEPSSIACLGAGVLNDIPFDQLVLSGASIHLVDLIPGIVDTGIGQSVLIDRDVDDADKDGYGTDDACVFCALGAARATKWCKRFNGARSESTGICGSFTPVGGDAKGCLSYERSELPNVHYQDVTGGYATAFGHAALEATETANSWKQAFGLATAAAKRLRNRRERLDIADGSIDLVTSSMLLSQFEHEPYDYFSRQVAARLGPPSAREENRLQRTLEKLKDDLLLNQIDAHCEEVARILAPEGRFFVAFELFHYHPARDAWFMVPEMHAALGRLARHFDFDFTALPPTDSIVTFKLGEASSVVLNFLMRHKHAA